MGSPISRGTIRAGVGERPLGLKDSEGKLIGLGQPVRGSTGVVAYAQSKNGGCSLGAYLELLWPPAESPHPSRSNSVVVALGDAIVSRKSPFFPSDRHIPALRLVIVIGPTN